MQAMANKFPRFVACALLCFAPATWADYYIVVNESNATASLTQTEALHLFMGRSRAFPDGGTAKTFELAGDDRRAGFYRALAGMGLAQVNSYWARLMFSGRNLPPQQLDGSAAMIEMVRRDPAAIGWLPEAPSQEGLRTVLVLRDPP
jgi:hypothetical protein